MQAVEDQLSGRTYRGALHVHTTCSDGKLTPEQCARRYRKLGYDFIFITDHDQWNDHSRLVNDDAFKVFSALELSCRGGREHVVALGVHEWGGRMDTQEAIDWVNAAGGIPVLCHPFWSRMSLRRALELTDYPLVEVWNTHGGLKYARETSHFWDLLLEEGRRVFAAATDDAHAAPSYGGGFVEVWAEALTEDAVLSALRGGRFCASSGPRVSRWGCTRDAITVQTRAPVRGAALVGDGGFVDHRSIAPGSDSDRLLTLMVPEYVRTYARLELEDRWHRRVWLQPVWRDGRALS